MVMIYRHLKILSGCDNFKYFRYFRPLSNALVKMKQRQYLHNVFSYLCIYLFYFLGKIVFFFLPPQTYRAANVAHLRLHITMEQ